MEEISVNFCAESLPGQFAENLNYVGNLFRGFFWNTQVQFMEKMGYLEGRPGGGTCEKVMSAIQLVPAIFSGLLGHSLIGLANRFYSRQFSYWEGEGSFIDPAQTQLKVMHLNACMFPGSLPCHFGKQAPAKERMDRLFNRIEELKPPMIFLCEFSQVFTGELCNRLRGEYKPFFLNIGSNALGNEAAFVGVSKVPILSAQFIPTQVEAAGDQKFAHRGYFIVETEHFKVLYAHLHPKETSIAKEIRRQQLDEIRKITDKDEKPWMILGDINIDRNKPEYEHLKEGFIDHIFLQHGNIVTCSEGDVEESVDYALTRDNRLKVETQVIQDLKLSDHSIIIATISLAQK